MSDDLELLKYWKVRESIRRTVTPSLLEACATSIRTWQKAGLPSELSYRGSILNGAPPDRRLEVIFDAMHSSRTAVERQLIGHLGTGRLVAWGRPASALAHLQYIPKSAWTHLHFTSYDKSVAKERASKTQLIDVRIYPTLEAPNAVDLVSGRTLVEALSQFVFGDPQWVARSEAASAAGPGLIAPGHGAHLYSAIWPVACGRGDWRSSLRYIAPRMTQASRVANVLIGRRFAQLIGYLDRGHLCAEGTNAEGRTVTIPRSIWVRDKAHIDVRNGDLVEYQPNAAERTDWYRPMFLGLMLKKPDAAGAFHVNARNNDRVRSTTVKAPRQPAARPSTKSRKHSTALDESIRAAINALWGGKRPPDLMVKQIYKQIIEWQRNNQRAVASPRTLQRYFSKRR